MRGTWRNRYMLLPYYFTIFRLTLLWLLIRLHSTYFLLLANRCSIFGSRNRPPSASLPYLNNTQQRWPRSECNSKNAHRWIFQSIILSFFYHTQATIFLCPPPCPPIYYNAQSTPFTYHSTASWVQQQWLAGTNGGQVEEQNVGHDKVNRNGGRIGEAHVIGDGVNVFRGHRHQFGPGLELGQSDDTVSNLKWEGEKRTIEVQWHFNYRGNGSISWCSSFLFYSSVIFVSTL